MGEKDQEQVAEKSEDFGKDPKDLSQPVDYGTHVEKSTELAVLVKSLYAADYDLAEAVNDKRYE